MLRFGLYVLQDAPFDVLAERWRATEAMGFDQLWIADHSTHFQRPGGPWFDGLTALAAAATVTERIRLGPLVSNPIVRTPQLLAREVHALDHLSGGRVEVGIGTGIADFDHRAMGSAAESARVRVRRHAEYVELVDGLLRAGDAPHHFAGEYYGAASPPLNPPTPQRPRPPILVGGQSPTVLKTAARFADVWNTHGPFGATFDETAAVTAQQNRQLDELLQSAGRAPAELRRSLLLYSALNLWAQVDPADALARTVERFTGAGVREFVFFWPADDERRPALERLAADLIPRLRG